MAKTQQTSDAEMVRQARAQLDMTQEEFGQLLGVSRRTIKRLEGGEPLPATTALAIVAIMGVVERLAAIRKAREA